MDTIKVERLDHLGIIAGVIKDLGIVEMIDHRIPSDGQQEITTGEAVAAMIINGLGFSNRPLYQWFGQFLFSSSSGGLVELSENSALRAATIGQAKSTGYFMKLRDWPEFDLIRPAGANRLIVGFKTVRTIG